MTAQGSPGAGIVLDDLTVAYDRHPAVHHLHGRFAPGSMTAVVGPNGAGKSTLLKAVMGAARPQSGRIDRAGLRTRDLAYLPQAAEVDRGFPISVADLVLLGAWHRIGAWRAAGPDRARADRALAAVGLAGFEARAVDSLSVGQFQRVLFARLLMQDAGVILLDEPFAAIDAGTTADLLALVRGWHGQGRTVIAVLHDFEQVRRHFPDTLLLAREQIAWGPTEQALSPDNLRRARAMAEAWDDHAPPCAVSCRRAA